jgi:hypothetical protein
VKQFNKYEAPEVLIIELEAEDVIVTSVGDGGSVDIGGDNWDW